MLIMLVCVCKEYQRHYFRLQHYHSVKHVAEPGGVIKTLVMLHTPLSGMYWHVYILCPIRPSVDGLYRDGARYISHVRCINNAL